ncbi:MAG TPA: serine/threonine-protein kinase [Gemmataceae bacterium]|nr:serine/threonine-protein kinase [Gemmataceae bacterium]
MPSEQLSPGARLGKYKVLAHIATGGMGTVYKASDEQLGRLVALKVLDTSLAEKPNTLERFRREARHAAKLSHKNIVTLYEYGHASGRHFLVLEYVDGIDLYDYIERKGRLAPEESRRILIQAVQALDHAFKQGITHRDIKPSNFLLTRDHDRMRVKLTDLGLARKAGEEDFRVTRAGSTVGTVDYLAPEQARDSAAADIRSDIYSLGCTFYHMLSGNPPFSEGGLGERILKHLQEEPLDVRQLNPLVSAEMWTLMQRMLAKKPEDRFQTPADLLKALKSLPPQVSEGEPLRLPKAAPPRRSPPLPSIEPGSGSSTLEFPEQLLSEQAATAGGTTPADTGESSFKGTSFVEDDPFLLELNGVHLQTAARQYERAEAARSNDNLDYAIELLLSCVKFNPVSIVYRRALREASRAAAQQRRLGSWLPSLTAMTTRARVNAAKRSGQLRKVLEEGEEVLVRHPGDVKMQMTLAEAAEELDLVHLASWMLEEVRRFHPNHLPAYRVLASLYEKQRQYSDAIAVWEELRKQVPYDSEAARKINDLAAADTIARGGYKH